MRLIHARSGTVLAIEDGAVIRARGIPYARAERFHYPEPVDLADFGDPFVADSPAPAAPQFLRGKDDDIRQSVLMSEDCQNLSVVFPADVEAGEELPVMVYFHGGSYVVGSGDGARYNPVRFVQDERVIVVTVTFRLGLLGFWAAPRNALLTSVFWTRERRYAGSSTISRPLAETRKTSPSLGNLLAVI